MRTPPLIFLLTTSSIFPITFSKTAHCILNKDSMSGTSGIALFVQPDENSPTWIVVNLDGLSPGYHGFHLQESNNFTEGCNSTGLHFNPFNETHGGPFSKHRHIGDLGNILVDETGNGRLNYHDGVVSLYGNNSIIGKACMLHGTYDDLGLGHHEKSLVNGGAMGKLNCGEIIEGFPEEV